MNYFNIFIKIHSSSYFTTTYRCKAQRGAERGRKHCQEMKNSIVKGNKIITLQGQEYYVTN